MSHSPISVTDDEGEREMQLEAAADMNRIADEEVGSESTDTTRRQLKVLRCVIRAQRSRSVIKLSEKAKSMMLFLTQNRKSYKSMRA